MPVMKISPKTWSDVKNEQRKLRLAFGEMLLRERESKDASLRELGDKYGLSHMTVQNLIDEYQSTRRTTGEKVTAA